MRAVLPFLILGVLVTGCAESELDADVVKTGSSAGGAAGAATGGGNTGGWATGGLATGGLATGGGSTGGVATGGVATGGVSTGGGTTGGARTGGTSGTATGGASTGGTRTGGTGGETTGGVETGGVDTGGTETGGTETGGVETGGTETGGDGSGGGGSVDCDEATAKDLGTFSNTKTALPADGCAVVTSYPTWWGTATIYLRTDSGGTYPVPFVWENACSGASGTGTFTGPYTTVELGDVSDECATLIDLDGTAGSTLQVYWQNSG